MITNSIIVDLKTVKSVTTIRVWFHLQILIFSTKNVKFRLPGESQIYGSRICAHVIQFDWTWFGGCSCTWLHITTCFSLVLNDQKGLIGIAELNSWVCHRLRSREDKLRPLLCQLWSCCSSTSPPVGGAVGRRMEGGREASLTEEPQTKNQRINTKKDRSGPRSGNNPTESKDKRTLQRRNYEGN